MNAGIYSAREELLHAVLHGAAAGATLIGTADLVLTAAKYGDAWRMAGGAIFGLAALLLFATSTLYHASRAETPKKRLYRKLDHTAIYILIAGSYTAFAISVLRGYWGWTLFAAMWIAAACGIAAEFSKRAHRPIRSSAIYIGMGWVGLIAVKPLVANLSPEQLRWLVAGGVVYTAGVPFYVWKSRPYMHVLWHLFVIGGVACHFVAVLSVMHAN